ncbi:H-type lectin domain-containing protein [Primorskyibacter sp. S87]|uniref:H-type lectin domain-containing protein n=1 Tax=Primorskyibacter sp. S87 TaxID=3415126 RepID=UPI003C7D4AF7
MKRFLTHPIGIEQGDVPLFADFENDGPMWTGSGPREARKRVKFSEPFRGVPAVQVSISLWDVDTATAVRAEVLTDRISTEGFEIVFRTWLDTRFARLRVAWTAIGEIAHEDDWDIP